MLNSISSYFLKIVAYNLDIKIKLKIFMNNKLLLKKLEIGKKDFAKYYAENVLNKYDSKHLKGKSIDNNVIPFLDLTKVLIKDNDYILNLSDNYIEDLKLFTKGPFLSQYDFLYLSNNLISNIEELEKDDFKDLLRITLSMNKIKDISVLERTNFKQLKALNLSNNKILDISILEKTNLNELYELYLHGNEISDIKVLKFVKFPKLEILDLSKNKIFDITVFKNLTNFQKLNYLYLNKNQIKDISIFINWLINYNKMIRADSKESGNLSEDPEDPEDPVFFLSNNIKFKKILGNLEILDLSNNKITFHDNFKRINTIEKIYELKQYGTVVILDNNNIYIF